MKSKRILFVLFTCVFALYGCVSATSIADGTANNDVYVSEDTINKPNMFTQLEASNMQKMALQAYAVNTVDTRMFTSLRNVDGTLAFGNDMNRISSALYTSAKEEKARKDEEARKKAEQERLEKEAEATAFTPKITTYGLDCYGCSAVNGRGGTAMGVALDLSLGVQQPDGSWMPGIRYGGYYIIAADRSIPMCSIVKISDHGLSGEGISLDQPIYAMVLDRGGGINGNHFDLYVGSQYNSPVYRINQGNPKATIVRRGGQNGNSCAL